MPKISEAYVQINAALDPLRRGMRMAERESEASAKKAGSAFQRHFTRGLRAAERGLTRLATYVKTFAIAAAAAFVAIEVKALKAGMAARETANLFDVAMGSMKKNATDWAKTYSDAMRLNTTETKRQLATLHVMLKSMGLAESEAYNMAKSLTELAADMASFYNLPHEEAFRKIQAGMSGEIEPLKRLGILLHEQVIADTAYREGIAKTGEKLTQVQKVRARHIALLGATLDAQGDLARTMDSETNLVRAVQAAWQGYKESLGAASMEGGGFAELLRATRRTLVGMAEDTERLGSTWDRVFKSMADVVENLDLKVDYFLTRTRLGWARFNRFIQEFNPFINYRNMLRGAMGKPLIESYAETRERTLLSRRHDIERRIAERGERITAEGESVYIRQSRERQNEGKGIQEAIRVFSEYEQRIGQPGYWSGLSGAVRQGAADGVSEGASEAFSKFETTAGGMWDRFHDIFGKYLPGPGRGDRTGGARARFESFMEAYRTHQELQFLRRMRGGLSTENERRIGLRALARMQALGPEFFAKGSWKSLVEPTLTKEEQQLDELKKQTPILDDIRMLLAGAPQGYA